MKEKNIYLAGAMGCYGTNQNKALTWRLSAETKIMNYMAKDTFGRCTKWSVINPCDYYMYNEHHQHTEKEIMRFDLNRVSVSDVILVNLADLDKSLGTSDEMLYAYMHNIPVIGFLQTDDTITENELQELLHPWKYEQINRIETGLDALDKAIEYICEYYKF